MSKKKKPINKTYYRFLFTGYLFFIFLSCGCTCLSIPLFQGTKPLSETTISGKGKDKILIIDISGTISTKVYSKAIPFSEKISIVSRVKEELKKAASNKRIKGVILRINSPGGSVTASDIIYKEIKEFKKDNKIPVIACMMDVAASGGYYISLAADTILAHPTSITGSIGVIAVKFNTSKLLDKIGVEDETIKSGDKKDLLSPFRPNTEEEKEILNQIIGSLYQRFLDVIAKERKELSMEQIRRLADGRVFTTKQAVDAKLIDKVGYLEDAVELVKKEAGIPNAKVIIYHRRSSYRNNIYSKISPLDPKTINLINIDIGTLPFAQGLHFMYLWLP
ncbi:MAG: signal peptide peptidase SppA [Thermodesulfobacteriota bacterium]|nr:signal peptide peptidase SppA [Thermodesulfobacteriota bacterium]